jgi:hypothetical protein
MIVLCCVLFILLLFYIDVVVAQQLGSMQNPASSCQEIADTVCNVQVRLDYRDIVVFVFHKYTLLAMILTTMFFIDVLLRFRFRRRVECFTFVTEATAWHNIFVK